MSLPRATRAGEGIGVSIGTEGDAARKMRNEGNMKRGIASVGIVVAACAAPVAPTPSGLVGRYTLRQVDASPMPVGTIRAGWIELRTDGTFTDDIVLGSVEDQVTGTYRRDADSVRMIPKDWTPYAARWDGANVLTVRWGGNTFLYRR